MQREDCTDFRTSRREGQCRSGLRLRLLWEPVNALFKVLTLFTRLLNLRFQSQPDLCPLRAGARNAGGLREHGVGLAIHLLEQKVELLAQFPAPGEHLAEVF